MDIVEFSKQLTSALPITKEGITEAVKESRAVREKAGTYDISVILHEFVELMEEVLNHNNIYGILEELADCVLSVAYLADYFNRPWESVWDKASRFANETIETGSYSIYEPQLAIVLCKSYKRISKLLPIENKTDPAVVVIIDDMLQNTLTNLACIKCAHKIEDDQLNRAIRVKVNRELERIRAYKEE